ncbi:MAG: SO2930 family diheme c-type cytochrome [Chakrabartia sp.]
MKRVLALAVAALSGALVSAHPRPASPVLVVNDALLLGDSLPPRLQDFGLLVDGRTPAPGVRPYHLNTPLFSDYAEKFRFVYVPKGSAAQITGDGLINLPVGSVLIKSFGYPADLRQPDRDVRILETRLLIHRATGWVALPYVWNADGTEAVLKRAGQRLTVSWTHLDGQRRTISYAVPNANQCKGCHVAGGVLSPIGPKARNLNDGHQLQAFKRAGLVVGDLHGLSALPVWNNPKTGSVAARARAYLDVNCSHCHNRNGPADSSGLWLDWDQPAGPNLGIRKRPTAAGRGSAGLDFAVLPGDPDHSYLVARMASLEPGIAMPELGRATVHDEGVALIRDWIREMK